MQFDQLIDPQYHNLCYFVSEPMRIRLYALIIGIYDGKRYICSPTPKAGVERIYCFLHRCRKDDNKIN